MPIPSTEFFDVFWGYGNETMAWSELTEVKNKVYYSNEKRILEREV